MTPTAEWGTSRERPEVLEVLTIMRLSQSLLRSVLNPYHMSAIYFLPPHFCKEKKKGEEKKIKQ